MPFHGLENGEIQKNFQSAKTRIHELMDKYVFDPEEYKACEYFDEKKVLFRKKISCH